MVSLSRRRAIGVGVMSGSALLATLTRAEEADEDVIAAGEKAVLFKIKGVMLERVDQDRRTIDASLGKHDRPIKLEGLPLGENIRIRVSYVKPGVANNLPFDWDRLKGLVGRRVSVMLRAASGGLSVDSIATNND
jgi:hypothetical protein